MSSNGKINEQNYWISSNDGKQAIWYDPKYSNWKIGSKSNLGSSTAGLYSKYDTACPSDDGKKWKYYDGDNWVDAGNDAQAACHGK